MSNFLAVGHLLWGTLEVRCTNLPITSYITNYY